VSKGWVLKTFVAADLCGFNHFAGIQCRILVFLGAITAPLEAEMSIKLIGTRAVAPPAGLLISF
jgi:hypothetical protein